MLDVKSNNKGLLPPRMTKAEMMAIPNPANGLIIYCTDCLREGNGVLATFMNGNWNTLNINCIVPLIPTIITNIPSASDIVWDWKEVPYAIGYKWNITNDYGTATQMDTVTTKAETGLVCNTAYARYVWAYNTCGNSLPLTLTQTTLACSVPTISTTDASAIASTTTTSGGNITSDGGSEVTDRGSCWGTVPNPTTADSKTSDDKGVGTFTSNLTGLIENTTYFLRAYAINSYGTGYGNEITFKTNTKVTDIDGNIYNTVTIGTQTWMVENLKTTKYRNGEAIPNVTDDASWESLTSGGYCWYNNDAATYKAAFGALYNWYAVADSRNVAPTGWHVPTDGEWTTLTNYLGGTSVAGGKLKEDGPSHWLAPNTGATNSTGFTALPGGCRGGGIFTAVGDYGYWWSSKAIDKPNTWSRNLGLYNNGAYVYRYNGYPLQDGFSVRCIKD
jgi:uncharacterized protein (TIGR02145 family)